MAYKQSPFPYVRGTNKHISALKGRFAQVGAAGANEDEVDSAMKSHKPGHAEMDVNKWQYESSGLQGEGKDQDKILDKDNNWVGNWVDGKKVMFKSKKSTESAHGQLDDAEIEYQEDLKREQKAPTKYRKCDCGKKAMCNCK
tara:strand:- start:3981 stop:4406 length:426 start_codon:yes stop_codon:yes gene_type:complete